MAPPRTVYEFFAGGGMVRAGLGPDWTCAFANDIDPRKGRSYRANWGGGQLTVGDVAEVPLDRLPGRADLMWGSFPCQDLSEAGGGAGLRGARSSAFFPFWDLVTGLAAQGRAPRLVAIENVRGALTSQGGAGFTTMCRAFAEAGYRFGPMMIDAALFVPQSRPRLFIVGVAPDVRIAPGRMANAPQPTFHPPAITRAATALPPDVRAQAVWWQLPPPPPRDLRLADLIDDELPPQSWRTAAQTEALVGLMAPIHLAKVEALRRAGARAIGAVYRRTRRTAGGQRVQRAEVRFDDVAGCLRTPAGGSSRQAVLVIEDGAVRSRLLSPRETARLMGLSDDYVLPSNAGEAYHLTGDGVVTHVVRHLAKALFEPLLANCSTGAASDGMPRRVPSLDA